jgi:NAD(P)-dependent dehydrogenase (short-subunit alcohol dehydrogenase family)
VTDANDPRSRDLTGRAVLVTGGTKGLGRGLAEAFRQAGADVLVCARSEPATLPDGVGFMPADLRDAAAAAAVVDEAVSRFGRLDVVVNNAGGSPEAEAATVSPRFVEKVVALNLLAPFYVAQRANTHMQQQDSGGVIVNIGSLSGHRPSPGTAAYGAAKAGLASLTRSLAVEWAPTVRVNAIDVGMVRTEQTDLHYGGSAGVAAIGATVPLGRLATPREVGNVAAFLASPLAAYVSGATIEVHGGGEAPAFLAAAQSAAQPADPATQPKENS